MLGPALRQLLSALSQVPDEKKSDYGSRLQAELTILADISQSWKRRVVTVGQSVWWSDPNRQYHVWLTSTPEGRVVSAERADNAIYAGGFRMPINRELIVDTLEDHRPAHAEPTLAELLNCSYANCPLK